jgi:hypothetical protein
MTVHRSQRAFAIGEFPQDDYDTPVDASDETNFVGLSVVGDPYGQQTPVVSDNAEEAHGSEFATEEFLEGWDTQAPLNIGCSSEQIGRFLLLATGNVVTTQPAAISDPTVYQHVFTLQDPTVSRQLPVASVVEVVGAALNRLHPSMLLGQLGLSGDGIKRIEAQAQFNGTGATTTPSGLTVADMETIRQTGLHYFFNSQAHATIADAGTLLNAVAYGALKRFNSWSWGLNNNPLLEEGYRPGSDKYLTAGDATSGAVRAELLFGLRAITASQLVRLQSQADELAALKSRKDLDWKLELIGGTISNAYKHKLAIELTRVRYSTVELGSSQGGLVTQQINMKPFGSNTGVMSITLTNTVQSYVAP